MACPKKLMYADLMNTKRVLIKSIILGAVVWSYDIWSGAFMMSLTLTGGVA